MNYWEEFCDKTLGRKLHHHPSKGGLEEKEKHIAWLQETMENYQLVFEEAPPPDIWNPQYQPIAKHSPLSRKFTPANLFIIIPGILGVGAIFWGQAFLLFPIIVTGAVVYKMFAPNQSEFGTGSDTGSGGCSSGGGDSSGCGSSCGGGCGGCGGGD